MTVRFTVEPIFDTQHRPVYWEVYDSELAQIDAAYRTREAAERWARTLNNRF